MPTSTTTWEILPASVQVATADIVLVEAGSPALSTTLRTLTHPDGLNFPPVTYSCNPDRTINFDRDVLYPPTSRTIRTLGTTQLFVESNSESDVTVTEIWSGSATTTRIIASFFRRLYELAINPPAIQTPEVFVQWAPADRTADVYNVIIAGIRLGGEDLDFREWGSFPAGTLDVVQTGLLDRTLELDLKIVSKVPAA